MAENEIDENEITGPRVTGVCPECGQSYIVAAHESQSCGACGWTLQTGDSLDGSDAASAAPAPSDHGPIDSAVIDPSAIAADDAGIAPAQATAEAIVSDPATATAEAIVSDPAPATDAQASPTSSVAGDLVATEPVSEATEPTSSDSDEAPAIDVSISPVDVYGPSDAEVKPDVIDGNDNA